MRRWLFTSGAALLAALAVRAAAGDAPAPAVVRPAQPKQEQLIQAEPPPFSDGIFPCSGCHASLPKNGARRELAFHDEQTSVFSHDAEHRWCLDCHDLQDRDVLHLSNGDKVPFTESYRLCGQCHGDKYRDWRAGVHGKRVGRWDGAKTYFLCVNCHNPHAPRFAPLKPEPRPRRPEEMHR